MTARRAPILALLGLCLLSCQPMVDRAADSIAATVSERVAVDVAEQVATAVVEQVGTALAVEAAEEPTPGPSAGETGPVIRVIDGDTIDVLIDGVNTRIRYLQMNTPERDEPCSRESTAANSDLVKGQTVRLVPDKELVDPYGRLLRFVYVGDLLVNRVLVEKGFAEVVLYPPNDAHYEEFRALEDAAAAAGLGCHPSGIFADGTHRR